ncbi:MAG: hypothetical protein ACR2NZ_15345 [Rubripirellula sp.]
MMCGGCGTILHHERIHEPHSRDIDWKIAALDGLGLALFFVPGVVAFVVDFYTGAIYLPPRGTPGNPVASSKASAEGGDVSAATTFEDWERRSIEAEKIEPESLERLVSEYVGDRVSLQASNARVSELSGWGRYRQQLRTHLGDSTFGVPAAKFLQTLRA